MHILIREALPSDAAAVSALSSQLGYDCSVEQTAINIVAASHSENDIMCLAVDGEKVAGWIHAFYSIRIESASFCEIAGLVTDEAYRGKGIGKMLVEHVKPWCLSKQCHLLKVRSNVKRDAAHRFYIQNGFHEVKEQKVFETAL